MCIERPPQSLAQYVGHRQNGELGEDKLIMMGPGGAEHGTEHGDDDGGGQQQPVLALVRRSMMLTQINDADSDQ